MRNATTTLTPVQRMHANVMRQALTAAQDAGKSVSGEYTKRETGERKAIAGTVLSFHGERGMSNDSVRMLTESGERTYNLYLFHALYA